MAVNFSGGIRDGGFAGASGDVSRLAREIATQQVNRQLGTNFSAGSTPGGRAGGGGGLAASTRDGGFASTGNAAAQAAANAEVNALIGSGFGFGDRSPGLLGGYGLNAGGQPVRPVGAQALIPNYNPVYRQSEFNRFYGNMFGGTPEEFGEVAFGQAPLMGKYARDASGRYILDDQGNYITIEPSKTDLWNMKSQLEESPDLRALGGSILEPINRASGNLAPDVTAIPTPRFPVDPGPRGVLDAGNVAQPTVPDAPASPSANVDDFMMRIARELAQRQTAETPPPAQSQSDSEAAAGLNVPGGFRGVLGPNGELRIQPTSYGTNYQTAQALQAAYPNQFGKYSTEDVAQTLETFSQAVPGEAFAQGYGNRAMNNVARVGLNQIIGGYSLDKMLRGMDTTGMRSATRGFEVPGPNSAGMTDNWYNQQTGDAYRNLAANAIREAAFGQGVSPQAMNASNFVAQGTKMVPGVNAVGEAVYGTQFGSDPTWGTRIADRNEVALGLLGLPASGTYAGSSDVVVPPSAPPPEQTAVNQTVTPGLPPRTPTPPPQQVDRIVTPAAPPLESSGRLTDTIPARTDRQPSVIETPVQDAIGNTMAGLLGVDYGGYPNAGSARLGWDTVLSDPTSYSPPAEDANMFERFANVFEPGNLFPYAKDVNPIEGTPEGQYIQQTETGPLKGYIDVPYRYEAMDKPVYGAPGVPDGWTAPVKGASVITFKDGGGVWKHPTQGWQSISQFRGDMGDTYKGEGGKQAKREVQVASELNADGTATTGSTTDTASSMLPQWYLDWLASQGRTGGILA